MALSASPNAAVALNATTTMQTRFRLNESTMAALAFNATAAFGLALNAIHGGSIFFLYACLFLYGTSRSFIMPSRAAFLPGIVRLEIFSTAVSWNSSGFDISSMVGPAIGGLLIGAFQSPTLVYAING